MLYKQRKAVRSKPVFEVKTWPTYQIFCVERDVIPPGGDKLIIAVEDATVHVLVSPWVKERLKPTEPEKEREREGGEREVEKDREREREREERERREIGRAHV